MPAIRSVHRRSIRELGRRAYDEHQIDAWAAGCDDADYTASIEATGGCVLVAERGGEVVGFASGTTDPDEDDVDAEVTGLYVAPSVARRGIGSALLAALEGQLAPRGSARIGLTASRNAVGFYERHGYAVREPRTHEFSPHLETGVTGTVVRMRRDLG